MDYRRRYLRRLAERNKLKMNEEQANTNKVEEKPITENVDEKNNNNLYLQKLLVKNSNPLSSSINLSSVNESLPSFTTNMTDILTKEENKQKAIKYLIQKRSEQKYSSYNSMPIDNEKEESNPVLSNKYSQYSQYSRSININSNIENNRYDTNKNDKNPKRIELSSSTNIKGNNDSIQQNIINSSVYLRNRLNSRNINDAVDNNNNNKEDVKEKDEKGPSVTRFKYHRTYKRNENEQNDKNESKKENIIEDKEKKNSTTKSKSRI